MLVALAEHAVRDVRVDQQPDAVPLEDARTDGLLDLDPTPVIDDDGVDAVLGQQVTQHQSGGSTADDADSGRAALDGRR